MKQRTNIPRIFKIPYMAKDTYYFSHDYHARYDIKAKLLCKEYGAAGYGIYWIIVEMMHENEKNEVAIDDLFLMDLATDYRIDYDTLKKLLDDCVNKYKLFKIKDDVLTSERVKKNKLHRQDLKIKRSEAGRKGAAKKWQLPSEGMANANGKMANDGKGKESKGKEIVGGGGESWHFTKIDGVAIQLITYRPDITKDQAVMEAKICLDKTGGNASASYIAEYARRISKAQRFVVMRSPFGQELKWTEEDFEKRKLTTEFKFVRYEMG